MADLRKHLDTLHDHARSFVTHWASDDGADDIAEAREACRDVVSAASALSRNIDAARAMLTALKLISHALERANDAGETFPASVSIAAYQIKTAIAAAEAAGITPKED